MKKSRYGLFVTTHAGKLWAIGGVNDMGICVPNVEIYDPEINSWTVVQISFESITGEVCGCNIISSLKKHCLQK